MSARMTNLLRFLPVLGFAVALVGSVSTAHAEDTLSSSPSATSSTESTDSVDLSLSMGSGGFAAGKDWSYDGIGLGISALYYTKSGHGLGVRGTATSDHILWNGVDTGVVDAVYAFRPWQAQGAFALVPSFFVGPGWMSSARYYDGGLFETEKVQHASALTVTAGAALDLHIVKHFILGLEGNGRVAVLGDEPLRGAVGWNALVHLGGEINF
jgi:hypothetical protein